MVDTGSDGENTIALRRRVDSGEVLGPRIFTAGIPMFPAHALPYSFAELPPELKAKMAQPETAADAVTIVDRNRAAGCDIVKLFTGSIVSPGHITPMQVAIARAAVDEAHRHGPAFSHSSNLEGTKVAIDAGVDVLAHTPEDTSGIDEAMLRRMIAQHMTIIPTLKLFSRDDDIANIRGLDYRFRQLGGRLVYGTDTGFLPDYDQSEEFRQLMQAGFGFREVLAMLTTAPAELFHLSQREGKVMPGMRGDLTILSEDPASGNPEVFTKVVYDPWRQGDLALELGGEAIRRRNAERTGLYLCQNNHNKRGNVPSVAPLRAYHDESICFGVFPSVPIFRPISVHPSKVPVPSDHKSSVRISSGHSAERGLIASVSARIWAAVLSLCSKQPCD